MKRHPFALSMSKGCFFLREGRGFDRLSPSGECFQIAPVANIGVMEVKGNSTMMAIGQVAMMPLIALAILLSTLSFIIFTGLAIMAGFGLLLFGLPEQGLFPKEFALLIAAMASWIISCRGVVVGMSAAFDPTCRSAANVVGHASFSCLVLIIMFGDIW